MLLAVLGIAVALGGIAMLHSTAPSNSTPAEGPGADTGTAAAAKATGSGRPLSNRAVYDLISPSVVDITAILGYDDETASGTGFFVDPRDGLVRTNNHVIRDATSVTVGIPGTGRTYQAQVVGADLSADIAVLRILPQPGAPSAPIGDSATVSVGTTVIAIGNRAGAGGPPVLAGGVISATGRTIAAADGASGFTETLHNMLQTTAKIQPGDSGGPLADAAGSVIRRRHGRRNRRGRGRLRDPDQHRDAGRAGDRLGAPLPRHRARGRRVPRGDRPVDYRRQPAGAGGRGAEPRRRSELGSASQIGCLPTEAGAGVPTSVAPVKTGALVDGVLCGTAADAAGLTAGDVIITADGRAVSSPDALTAIVNACRPGSVVEVTWVSPADATRTSRVRLDSAPAV